MPSNMKLAIMDEHNCNIHNCFSVDVEGFIESNVQSFFIERKYFSSNKENYEIEKNVSAILGLLDASNTKATFFFLGRIGRDIPHIIRETARYGHEIACHSDEHLRVFDMTRANFMESLSRAKKILEDTSGCRVYGFRAPDFSITNSSIWALDVLQEVGFAYDSSICPTDIHDVYGIGNANPLIHRLNNGLIEFPVSVVQFFKWRIPFGGGGYFRLYPLSLTKFLMYKINKNKEPCMLYIHPYEAGPIIPRVSRLSHYRKFRHYYNCMNGGTRLMKLLKAFKFYPAIDILKGRSYIQ